ncbi:cytochrome P450 [Streptomyces wuyuanensis]|uniref:cytochrome P450 n=1 Tax=Streptomyces wuyuanensis TaxID=1196353 RepID=UPI0037210945
MPDIKPENAKAQQSHARGTDPSPDLRRLRLEEPVSRRRGKRQSGEPCDAWFVTRYKDVREVLASPHVSSSRQDGGGLGGGQPGFLVSMDPPDHTRIRRMLTAQFTVKRIQALRPRLEEIVTAQLNEMERIGSPADLMSHFALPFSALVICELLGVPYEDRADFQRRTEIMLDFSLPPEMHAKNYRETHEYIAALIAKHRKDPGEDILGTLVRERGDEISDPELIGISSFLLVAGHETTANTIGVGTLLLLQHPEQMEAMRRGEGDYPRSAVEEILRYYSVVHTGTPRWAKRDLVLSGQRIKAGDMIIVSLASANHDEELLNDAGEFDVTRKPSRHVTFGHGIHQCLGQHLARTQLAVAFPALLDRFPGMRLAVPESELSYRTRGLAGGVTSLPLEW